MSDQLYNGRRPRLLTIVDNDTSESLVIHVGQRIWGIEVGGGFREGGSRARSTSDDSGRQRS